MNQIKPILKKSKTYSSMSFSDYRKQQEKNHHNLKKNNNLFDSILTIELNLTELCNRKCVFCPRINPKVYPNRNLMMDIKLCKKLSKELKELKYKGRISFSGFGEPLLNKNFIEYVKIFSKTIPSAFIETNTNGDRLTPLLITTIYQAGLNGLYVNLYDGKEQIHHFKKLFAEANVPDNFWKLRPHWIGSEKDFGLILNNRSGMLVNSDENYLPLKEAIKSPCHYPFYKLFIDWNGDVLGCSNDWGRKLIFGNVLKEKISHIWINEKFTSLRKRLIVGNRDSVPCKSCNIDGTITGSKSVKILKSTL